jgi:outer membrane PBP1 activator LpoA protein
MVHPYIHYRATSIKTIPEYKNDSSTAIALLLPLQGQNISTNIVPGSNGFPALYCDTDTTPWFAFLLFCLAHNRSRYETGVGWWPKNNPS